MKNEIDLHPTSDGWRGITTDTFTFGFVEKASSAVAQYILKRDGDSVYVGYDTRFLSREFAMRACHIFASYGIQPVLSKRPIPTPVVSFKTNEMAMVCGITVTASHNPYFYNGIKARMGYGGPPDVDFTSEIEALMSMPMERATDVPTEITEDDPMEDYAVKVRALINKDVFNSRRLRIAIDTMHGATRGFLKKVLEGTKCEVQEINNDFDPYFGGVAPEPQSGNTLELQRMVKGGDYDLGVAHDGDGDRIIAVTPKRGYMSPHDIAVSLLWYLSKVRLQTGAVVGSVTLSKRVARIADYLGLKYIEVPIGFRNACKLMCSERVLIAAEENGGIGFGVYLPERDGTLVASLLAEAELCYDGGIDVIMKDIEKIAGSSGFSRLNIKTSSAPRSVMKLIELSSPDKIAGKMVDRVSMIDGVKMFFHSGDWVCIRAAGTENLIRIYAESTNDASALKLATETEKIVSAIDTGIRQ